MRGHPESRPRDHTDAAKDIEPQTSPENIASQIASLKGEANTWLSDPSYATLRFRLESAHAAVEAATVKGRRVRLNKGDRKRG